jgi:hypothetical protein
MFSGNPLEYAARVSSMWSLAAFAVSALTAYLNGRRRKPFKVVWAIVTAVVILGLLPIAGSLYVDSERNRLDARLAEQVQRSKDLYRVRITVLDPHAVPNSNSHVWSDKGGEPKQVEGGWQFDIPTSMTGTVIFYAKDEYLTGSTSLELGTDFNPTRTIQLVHHTDANIRGTVVDTNQKHVSGVLVEVVGYSTEGVTTKDDGGFVLAAHCAEGEQVQLHAQKAGYKATYQTHSAGDNPATLIMKR